MNTQIESLTSTTFANKKFTRKQLADIQKTVKSFPKLTITELGMTICEHHNLFTHDGKHRIQLCQKALNEMQEVGLFKLPAKQTRTKKAKQKALQWGEQTAVATEINETLDTFSSISVEVVTESKKVSLFNEYIDRYHYLGYRRPIGKHLRYFIIGENQTGKHILGCLIY